MYLDEKGAFTSKSILVCYTFTVLYLVLRNGFRVFSLTFRTPENFPPNSTAPQNTVWESLVYVIR